MEPVGDAPKGRIVSNDNQRNRGAQAPKKQAMQSNSDPIAMALRRLHDDVVSEPVPDDFMKLLSEIDRKIGSDKDGQ